MPAWNTFGSSLWFFQFLHTFDVSLWTCFFLVYLATLTSLSGISFLSWEIYSFPVQPSARNSSLFQGCSKPPATVLTCSSPYQNVTSADLGILIPPDLLLFSWKVGKMQNTVWVTAKGRDVSQKGYWTHANVCSAFLKPCAGSLLIHQVQVIYLGIT